MLFRSGESVTLLAAQNSPADKPPSEYRLTMLSREDDGIWTARPENDERAFTGPGNNTDTYTPQNSTVSITYYYCVITQSGGQGCEVTSLTAEVQIVPGPSFTTQPQNDMVCIGAIITINITYQNGTGTPQYQWYSNNIKIGRASCRERV